MNEEQKDQLKAIYDFISKAYGDNIIENGLIFIKTVTGVGSGSTETPQSFSVVDKLPMFRNLTTNNFILVPKTITGFTYVEASAHITARCNPKCNYNANTGVLTISGIYGYNSPGVNKSSSVSVSVDVYCTMKNTN